MTSSPPSPRSSERRPFCRASLLVNLRDCGYTPVGSITYFGLAQGLIPTTFFLEERLAKIYINETSMTCIGGYITEDVILTTSSCLGEYILVEDQENMSLYKFNPYGLSRMSIIQFHGLIVQPLQIHVHDFFSMTIDELYIHDLGAVVVHQKANHFFRVPATSSPNLLVETCVFYYRNKAGSMRKHSVSPWGLEDPECNIPSICSHDRECVKDVVYSIQADGLRCIKAEIPKGNPAVIGSPLICDGIVYGIITKFVNYDVYFSGLDHDFNFEFIQKLKN